MKHFKIIKFIFSILLLIISVISYAHFIEPKLITFKEYKIKNSNITDNFNGFKIVQISDIHYGRMFDKKMMKKLVNSVNNIKPDIVVLTGDLIDKTAKMNIEMSEEISKNLNKIEANIGKYAINGNQDLKFDEWTNIIKNSGFTNLNNSYDTIYKNGYNCMFIAGVSTKSDKLSINDKLTETINNLNSYEKDPPIYKILLMHEPDTIDEIENNPFDLVLSGHSHHGQVKLLNIPITLPNGAKKYYDSHYKINNTDLYISNGLGVSNYDFRLFNTPSFNIYNFIKETN